VQTLPAASFDGMLGFELIPGTSAAAVVTQGGVIWNVPLGGGAPSVFGDLSGLLIASPGIEEGLLGLAFSPGFQSNKRVYAYYSSDTACPAGFSRCTKLSRFLTADGTIDAGSEQVLLNVGQPFANHNGGQIAFGPDSFLYVALGDGGSSGDPQGNGQDLSTLLGSILRLDVSGSGYAVPSDNPFVGVPGARPEIYAYGLRNPWRFSFDRVTGDLWAGDVGQNKWEEVDRVVKGGNYGWNIMEGPACFQPPSGCSTAGLRLPRAVYATGFDCSVTGGYVYRGPSMAELYGWYVYGDFCSGRIWAANTADNSDPVLLADTGLPVASFGQLAGGELVALAFDKAIYRLQRQ
jgi:glucose/arabinose dehydrogenase